jgi:hypothetical protein
VSKSLPGSPVLPAVVGAVALVAALALGYVTVRDAGGPDVATTGAAVQQPTVEPESSTQEPAAVDRVPTRRLVSRPGRYAVAVPRGLGVERTGGTLRLTSAQKDLAVVVGRAGTGRLPQAEKRLLTRMRAEYSGLTVLGKEPMKVDGRPARATFGQAVNSAGTKIRFALVTVHAGKVNYSIASYAAHDSDPAFVLPQVNAIANGFEVLGRG